MMFSWIGRTLVLALFLTMLSFVPSGGAANAVPQKEIYVSPTGSDTSGDGSVTSPFATVHKAQAVVRSYLQTHTLTDDVVVYLREGTYHLDAPLTFEPEDSGKDGHRVVYRNMPNENAVLSGGTPVTGWTLDSGNVYRAEVGTSVDFRQLYVNESWGIRSREPEVDAYFTIPSGQDVTTQNGFNLLRCNLNVPGIAPLPGCINVANAEDGVEVSVLIAWMHKRLRISDVVQQGANTRAVIDPIEWSDITTQPQATAAYSSRQYWLENAREFLDTPGEWYLDRGTGYLYYMPRPGEDMNEVEVTIPQTESLIVLDGSFSAPVANLQFEGLDFRHTNWTRPNQYGFVDVQANSLIPSPPNDNTDTQYRHNQRKDRVAGAIHATTADNIVITGNEFENLGGTGVLFTMGGNDNVIQGNSFSDIAAGAIEIGNDADNPDNARMWPRRNTISNNFVTRIGKDYFGSVGILGYYNDSLTVEHNEVVDVPYSGISVGWGWTTPDCGVGSLNNGIRNNLVSDYMRKVVDGGGIYTLCAQPGSEITGNYVRSQVNDYAGIYLDGRTQNYSVSDNVIATTPYWLLVQSVNDQRAFNNEVRFNYADNADVAAPPSGNTISDNVTVSSGAWPTEAVTIMQAAGLESGYRSLRYGTTHGSMADRTVHIIDNTDDGFAVTTGKWLSSGGLAGKYGDDYRYATTNGSPAVAASWTPQLTSSGEYDVSVWFAAASDRCTNCSYTINHLGGSSTVTVNQTINGGQWVTLGRYALAPGVGGSVSVSGQANGTYLHADAVKFAKSDAVVIDNVDPQFTVSGTWHASDGLPNKFGADYRYANVSSTATATARWSPVLPSAGSYDVSVWYPTHANRCTTCTYTITSGSLSFTATANQTTSGGQWVRLGSYHFDPASAVYVEINNVANGTYVQADAVKFEKSNAVIVDNVDPQFTVSGTWHTSNGLPDKFGADYRYANVAAAATATARWTPVLAVAGSYEVSVWYPIHATRCTNCTYAITSGSSTVTAVVNQTATGGRWVSIGTYTFDPATPAYVQITNLANGTYVQADAVKFDPQ